MGTDADNPNYEIIPPDDGLDLFLALYPEIAIAFVVLDLLGREGGHHG